MCALRSHNEALSTTESVYGAKVPAARLQVGVPQSAPEIEVILKSFNARKEVATPPFQGAIFLAPPTLAEQVHSVSPVFSERMQRPGPVHLEPAATSYEAPPDTEDGNQFWADGITAAARNLQDARADILADRLERAVTALVQCRLGETQRRLEDLRRIVLDLYDEEIITREQACERGQIAATEFFDLLDDHRHREQSA